MDSQNKTIKEEEEMPPIFKALATILAWSLFVFTYIGFVMTCVSAAVDGLPASLGTIASAGLTVASAVLAAVAMKLRQMLG